MSDLCDRIGPYFDGELTPPEESRFARHLSTCTRCQAELEDLMGLEAALAGRRGKIAPRVPAAPPARRRWIAPVAGAVALAAAAALVIVIARPGDGKPRSEPVIALAERRAVEVRFSSAPFDRHRPYEVARGGVASEPIAMSTLVAFERRGDQAALVAAHALGGELARADSAAQKLAAGGAAEADRAALALLGGRPEEALAAAERALRAAPGSTVARWNRALALRDLQLPLAAAHELERVAESGEAGWAEEARERAADLRRAVAERDRGTAALRAGMPAVTAADVAPFPALARMYFLDSLRLADSAGAMRALRPVAEALDARAGDTTAVAALDEALTRDLAVRRRFHDRYRALIQRKLAPADVDALLRELAAAGPDVADLLAGAIVASGRTGAQADALEQALGRARSPWFTAAIERERLAARRAAGETIDAELAAAAAACDAVAWGYRCARLELDLADLAVERGRYADALAHATRARAMYVGAGAADLEDGALSYQGELARNLGREALALAMFEEVAARAGGGKSCRLERYGRIGAASVMLVRGDLAGVRAHLPAAEECDGLPDGQGVITSVDLARESGDAADRARAEAWIATAAADPSLAVVADIARGRLAIDADPSGGRTMIANALAALAGADDLRSAGFRAWATAALISDGGRRGDWAAVFADAGAEAGITLPARCALVVSGDDARVVVTVRDAAGAASGEARDVPVAEQATAALVPAFLRDRLAGCDGIAVLARAPLHGRSHLLPASLPWFFLGAGVGATVPTPATAGETLIVSDPATTSAPRLAPQSVPGARLLTGAAATPSAVLAALRTARHAELHVHGVAGLESADSAYLVLAPDADGRDRLTAGDVRAARFAGPVVVLAACRTADVAPHFATRWSLPEAFLAAGARAVIAADTDLPDREAGALFAELRTRLAAGDAPAAVLAELRTRPAWSAWAGHLMLFQRP